METNEKKPRKKRSKKLIITSIILALIVVLILLLPAIISSEGARKAILSKINNSIKGKADFASLSMGWFKGIKVTDISFNDNAGQTSIKVKQFSTKPHYAALLMGSLSLGKTVVDQPMINLTLPKKEETKQASEQTEKQAGAPILPVKQIDLTVNDGSLKVSDSKSQLVELSKINTNVNLRQPGQQSSLDAKMAVVYDNKETEIKINGSATPQDEWQLKGLTGDLTVEVNELNLASLEPLLQMAGINMQTKGIVSSDIKGGIKDGKIEQLTGTINGKGLDVTHSSLKGDHFKTKTLTVDVVLKSDNEKINIEQFKMETDWFKSQVQGTLPTTISSMSDFLEPSAKYELKGSLDCDVAALASQMPQTLGIKKGVQISTGQLTGNIETSPKEGERKLTAQLTLKNLTGQLDNQKIAISEPITLNADIASSKNVIRYDKVQLSSAFAKINCNGTNELLNYTADVNLAKMQAEVGQFVNMGGYKIAGGAIGKGKVSTASNKIASDGVIDITNLAITTKDNVTAVEPKANINYAVAVDNKENVLKLDSLTADAGLGSVSVKNAVLPLKESSNAGLTLPVTIKDVNLAKVTPFIALFTSSLKGKQLYGIAESQFLLSSKNNKYKIFTDSTKIANLKLVSPGLTPFEQKEVLIAVDADVKPLDIRKLSVVMPQIKIVLNSKETQENGKTKLTGQANLDYDWAAVSSLASPFMPGGLKLEGKRKDLIEFTSQYPTGQRDKLLANLDTKAKVGFNSANYKGMNFGPTEVDIQAQKGLLTIKPFTANVNSGQVNFGGSADFNKKPSLLQTPGQMQTVKDVRINDIMSQTILKTVNPLFANALNVDGLANFNSEKIAIPLAGATKNDIEVIGTVSINNITMKSSNLLGMLLQVFSMVGVNTSGKVITIHPTRFVLQKGYLRYDDMQVDIGSMPLNFKGVIGLDDSLNMTIILPVTSAGEVVQVNQQTTSSRIELPLKGTLDKPELDTGKVLQDNIKNILEGVMKKKSSDSQSQPSGQGGTTEEKLIKDALDKLFKK